MATALATRIANLQNEVSGQLKLIHRQMEQADPARCLRFVKGTRRKRVPFWHAMRLE